MPRYQSPSEVMRRKGCISCCALPAVGIFGFVVLAARALVSFRKRSI